MNSRTVDVSHLPTTVLGHRDMLWWGITLLMVIEGTVFALAIASYFYLRMRTTFWPPSGTPLPDLLIPTINLLLMFATCIPMWRVDHYAERADDRGAKLMLILSTALMIPMIVLRFYEFGALNCKWDDHAYASMVWTLLGLHFVHIIASFLEDAVFTYYIFKRPLDPKHRFDLSMNTYYYYFVAVSYIFVYAVVFYAPRFL